MLVGRRVEGSRKSVLNPMLHLPPKTERQQLELWSCPPRWLPARPPRPPVRQPRQHRDRLKPRPPAWRVARLKTVHLSRLPRQQPMIQQDPRGPYPRWPRAAHDGRSRIRARRPVSQVNNPLHSNKQRGKRPVNNCPRVLVRRRLLRLQPLPRVQVMVALLLRRQQQQVRRNLKWARPLPVRKPRRPVVLQHRLRIRWPGFPHNPVAPLPCRDRRLVEPRRPMGRVGNRSWVVEPVSPSKQPGGAPC